MFSVFCLLSCLTAALLTAVSIKRLLWRSAVYRLGSQIGPTSLKCTLDCATGAVGNNLSAPVTTICTVSLPSLSSFTNGCCACSCPVLPASAKSSNAFGVSSNLRQYLCQSSCWISWFFIASLQCLFRGSFPYLLRIVISWFFRL